jgi:flagellar hook-associated protein 3 FlgL
MRVTENIRLNTIQRNLNRLSAAYTDVSGRAASGLKLNKASDDPLGASYLSSIRTSLQQASTYRSNIGLMRSDVETAENAIAQAMELLNQGREAAMLGANDSLNAENRQALAEQVAALRTQLIGVANTKGTAGYLFSGNKLDTPAFASDGSYQGDEGVRRLETGANVFMDASVNGQSVFAPADGVNVFSVLDSLEAALRSGDGTQVSAQLSSMDTAFEQLNQSRSQTGLLMNRMDTADATLELSEFSLKKRSAEITDVDVFETLSQLTQLGTTLQQALAVARQTLNMGGLERF